VTSWSNPNEAWVEVARGIRAALEPARPDATAPGEKREAERQNHASPMREPEYEDATSQALAEQIEAGRARRLRLIRAGKSAEEVDREIVRLRRQIREGGQLRAGDALGDGRYLLLKIIGKGGFAFVWEALDRKHQQTVAIKVLHPAEAKGPSKRERFFRGARIMGELRHESIVRVLEPHGGGRGLLLLRHGAGGRGRPAPCRGHQAATARARPSSGPPHRLSAGGSTREGHRPP
jgi:hypothetical protein